MVDEARLRALDKDIVEELFVNDSLVATYAHLISLSTPAVLEGRFSRRDKAG